MWSPIIDLLSFHYIIISLVQIYHTAIMISTKLKKNASTNSLLIEFSDRQPA